MNPQILGLRVAGVIFGIMSLGQLTRVLLRLQIVAAGYVIPLWLSAVAFIVLAGLSLWILRLSRLQGEKGMDSGAQGYTLCGLYFALSGQNEEVKGCDELTKDSLHRRKDKIFIIQI